VAVIFTIPSPVFCGYACFSGEKSRRENPTGAAGQNAQGIEAEIPQGRGICGSRLGRLRDRPPARGIGADSPVAVGNEVSYGDAPNMNPTSGVKVMPACPLATFRKSYYITTIAGSFYHFFHSEVDKEKWASILPRCGILGSARI
jgi:hypothetical protein